MYIRNLFETISSVPVISVIRRSFVAAFLVVLTISSAANAQWRTATPRDTVIVPANQKTFVSSKIFLGTGVDMWISPWSTFTENDGSNTFGMDAAYTFSVNSSSLIPEVLNPPFYSGNQHLYKFTVTTIPGLNETKFVPIENTYQPSHNYTAHIASQGNKFQFRIIGDKDADYPRATGALNVRMARWTAGISVQNINLNFGNVLIGSALMKLDSLASYGLDPLQIDSMKIIDPSGSGDFSFLSEHDKSFTLQEQTNELKITFSPTARFGRSAELHIYSHNADPTSRERIIYLTGFGIAPAFGVGPHQIDFGKVRIGYPATGSTQISNAQGNADLSVNGSTHYQQYLPVPPATVAFSFQSPKFLPMIIPAGSIGQIRTLFSPTLRAKYQGVLQVRGDNNVPPDSVILTGEGAEPIPVLSPVTRNGTLDFGVVYRGNNSQRTLTLKNTGNWTLSCLFAISYNPAYTVIPADSQFIVEPDSSRIFTITFHPGTTIDSTLLRGLFVLTYDDYTKDTIYFTGIEIEPKVQANPLVYDFGKVKVGASVIATVSTLTNLANINISLSEEQVLPPGPFSEVGKIGSIDAHKTAAYICKFAPLVAGPVSAYAHFADNGKRDSILLLGIGAIAKSIFTPSPVNFGIVPSNKWDTLYTTLRDSGDYPLIVDSIKITGAAAADFRIVWQPFGTTPVIPPKDTIQPDSTIKIEVAFMTNALTGAVHQANLCVYYDDGTSDCIPLEAIEEAQFLQFGQSSVNFGKHRIKTHNAASAAFRNGSNKILSVGAVTTTSAANVFSVIGSLSPVNPKSTASVNLDFFPQARGFYTGYLHAFGGDIKTDSIKLLGQGAEPIPVIFPDTIVDFGIVPLLTQSPTKTFSLFDSGDWPITAVKVELVGNNLGEFKYTNSGQVITSDVVLEQNFSYYDVTFTPNTTTVFHTAKIIFTFDDGTQKTVILKGYDESPQLVLDADTINFGKVRIGAPASSYIVNIVSTSPNTLTAQNVDLTTSAPGGTYTATDVAKQAPVSGPITLMPRMLYPINIAFKPQSIGTFTAKLKASGGDVKNDSASVYFTGIGAAPMPQLSSQTLDFGSLFAGYPGSRSFTLKDSGNWPLNVISVLTSGANAMDFTLRNIPSQFDLLEDSSNSYIVDFKAVTPYQAAQRTAQIVFMLDDSSTFPVNLIEQDIAPIKVNLRVDNEYARIGDIVTPCLRLMSPLPDSLHILDLKGVITYDPTLVDLDRTGVVRGDILLQLGNWNLIISATDLPGTLTYELQGTGAGLSKVGSLLRMKFKPHDNDAPGSISPLTQKLFSFPLRSEVDPQSIDGQLVVDSACGSTHLLSGDATANMVDQNMPNPFGANIGKSETQIPFDIGFNNTPVTIRILDVSGKEIARPVDNRIFNQGRYTATVNSSLLGTSGAYFYEFRAGDSKPVFMKMVVRK